MANGTIAFDTLQTSGQITGTAKSLDTDYVVNGTAKAWVNFNGLSTIAIRDSFNISSLNDDGAGLYDYVYTNNMANINYSPCVSGSLNDGDSSGNTFADTRRIAPTTSLHGIRGLTFDADAAGSFIDLENCYAQVAGDLA